MNGMHANNPRVYGCKECWKRIHEMDERARGLVKAVERAASAIDSQQGISFAMAALVADNLRAALRRYRGAK